jgi:type II secretory pathway component PulF
MKTYIVTITKALGKNQKVQISASSKKQVIEKLSSDFGLGIAPIGAKQIQLKTDLPINEQLFYYPNYI